MQERQVAIGDSYTLTAEERDEVKLLARERTQANRSSGVSDAGIGPTTGLFKDMLGVGGEWAFARLAQVQVDTSVFPRSYKRGEDHGDLTYCRVALDIKTTNYLTGRLVVASWKKASRFIYGLMILTDKTGPTFEFRGFATPELVAAHPDNLGHGATFAVPQSDLFEWWQVDDYLVACDEHGIKACLDCPSPVV